MPSPVDFTISLASFPANPSYTPAQLAQAIVDRLTITPAEPWNSFQNGGTIPTSDVGPVLYQGMEWRVWNPALGAYTYHRQSGAGIISGTVPFTALAQDAVTGAVMTTNSGGNPTLLAPATNGQVLTLVGGVPVWVDTFVPAAQYFDVTLTPGDQQTLVSGAATTVEFSTARLDPLGAYDGTNFRMPVTTGEVWFLYAQLQLSEPSGDVTDASVELNIRKQGVNAAGIAGFWGGASITTNVNVNACGVVAIGAGENYVDVGVTATWTSNGLEIDANETNTRFGGYRII